MNPSLRYYAEYKDAQGNTVRDYSLTKAHAKKIAAKYKGRQGDSHLDGIVAAMQK